MNVYEAINAVQADLARDGIGKTRKNTQQGYSFRGIDDVYNVLSPLLAKHGLVILPRMLSRDVVERQAAKGGALFYVTVEAEFDFVSAKDGTKHVVRTYGEAMDSADKATNKAMSAAYKYATVLAFAIPTEGDNDADAHHHEVVAKPAPVPQDAQHVAQIRGCKTLEELQAVWKGLTTEQRRRLADVKDEQKARIETQDFAAAYEAADERAAA